MIEKIESNINKLKKKNKTLVKENHELYQAYFKSVNEVCILNEKISRLEHFTDKMGEKLKCTIAYEQKLYSIANELYKINHELKIVTEKLKSGL